MEGVELEQALKHDVEIKKIAPGVVEIPTPKDTKDVVTQLEQSQAIVAKTALLECLSLARTFCALAERTGKTRTVTTEKRQKTIEQELPRPEVSLKCLEVSNMALELARKLDVLGDCASLRMVGQAKKE